MKKKTKEKIRIFCNDHFCHAKQKQANKLKSAQKNSNTSLLSPRIGFQLKKKMITDRSHCLFWFGTRNYPNIVHIISHLYRFSVISPNLKWPARSRIWRTQLHVSISLYMHEWCWLCEIEAAKMREQQRGKKNNNNENCIMPKMSFNL